MSVDCHFTCQVSTKLLPGYSVSCLLIWHEVDLHILARNVKIVPVLIELTVLGLAKI